MATQRITIAKISGVSSKQVFSLFSDWEKTRQADDEDEWSANQWPSSIRESVDRFVEKIKERACTPPITFFSEYVDLWSFCQASRFFQAYDCTRIYSDK